MFKYFRSLGDNSQISDKHLSQKLLILLLPVGVQRLNCVFHFTIDRMIISSTSVIFSREHVQKHSKSGRRLDVFEYQAYWDPKLWVLECVKEYIKLRNDRINKDQKRLFSYNSSKNMSCGFNRHSPKACRGRPATLLKKRLCHRCFPVNFVKFLRTSFYTAHLWWLLLSI